ncbi:hypothetical protein [Sphingomonas hylomeconis]|uniref:Uncharacterized protein n=1 Tax=Sphingomonas hylomeconis TaxID=1395958 RepID=A0ABV7SVZ7_9SPHN|nr:hypothetical protein [Sphingomonas hylomeconis]
MIAVSLIDFERRCADWKLQLPCQTVELKRLLKSSKARKYLETKPVNSVCGKTVNCWVFADPEHATPNR